MSATNPDFRSRPVSSSARLLLIAAGGGLLLWNAVAISRLTSRLDHLEATQFEAAAGLGVTQSEYAGGAVGGQPMRRGTTGSTSMTGGVDNPMAYLDNVKQLQSQAPPEQMARELDAKLAQEPANPEQEMRAQQWLQQAAANTKGERVPIAAGVSATCRGRRCLTSATFANEGEARNWATRYLLTAGGTLLANSTTVVLPAAPDGSVTLQLYQF